MDAFIAALDKRKTCGLLFVAIMFGICGFWACGIFGSIGIGSHSGGVPFVIGLPLSIIFLVLCAVGLVRSISDDPVIRIDSHGVYARSIGAFIPWECVEDADIVTQKTHFIEHRFLMMNVTDECDLDLSIMKNAVAAANYWYVGYAHFINVRLTNRSFDELLGGFCTFAPERLSSDIQRSQMNGWR